MTDELLTRTRLSTNGIELGVATAGPGDGSTIVFLHGWPHTWEVWRPVAERLGGEGFRVIVPNMRGIGDSERPQVGYDVATLTADLIGVLDAIDVQAATIVAIDAGVSTAFYTALTVPERVSRLILMEGLLPGLAGAEGFLASGPPWWFGFHSVPGLAETVIAGNEESYLGFFLAGPSVRRDIGAHARETFIEAYTGSDALRAGFEHYRAFSQNATLTAAALQDRRLTVPTLAVAGGVVGNALHSQLTQVADDLAHTEIVDCGHIVPLEQPDGLAAAIAGMFSESDRSVGTVCS